MAPSKTIVITGGTGGIGYQEALWLAGMKEKHTIVITGRNPVTASKAVEKIKAETSNPNIHYAVADLSIQSQVKDLGKDLLARFPAIDELINNAGNLTTGERKTTADGVDANFAVNVVAPLLLTRALVPVLKAATPTGKVQITSGGIHVDRMDINDLEGKKKGVGLVSYSHSKRVMEAMAIALSRELEPEGIVVNVVGGKAFGSTSMTKEMSYSDMPWIMKPFYPCFKAMASGGDGGKSAKKCAKPCVLAVASTSLELGTGKSYLTSPTKEEKFGKEVNDPRNQTIVMEYIASKLVV